MDGLSKDQLPSVLRDQKLNLKHFSREAIRKQFITLNPHVHLFNRIPSLAHRLPPDLIDYLLYGYNLESKPRQTEYEDKESALTESDIDNDSDSDDYEFFDEYIVRDIANVSSSEEESDTDVGFEK